MQVETCVKEKSMKKLFSILSVAAALAAAVLLLSGCEKHAYSNSTNKFRNVETGSVFSTTATLNVGQTIYIIAAMDNGKGAYLTGKYTATPQESGVIEASVGSYGDYPDCIILKGVQKGETSVSLSCDHDGFHLYKTVRFTVR